MVGIYSHIFSLTQAEITGMSWVGPNEWNSNHALMLTLSGNTAGSSSFTGSSIGTLAATQNLTVSVDANSKVWYQGPRLSAQPLGWYGTSTTLGMSSLAATSGDVFGQLFILPTEMVVSRLDLFGSQALSAPTLASSTTTHTSSSSGAYSINVGLFSRTLSTLVSVGTTQYTLAYSATMSGSSSSQTDAMTVTWQTAVPYASLSQTFTGTTNSTSGTLTAGNTGSWTGNIHLPFPIAATLAAGEYWAGAQFISSGTSGAGPQLSFYLGKLLAGIAFNYIGQAGGATIGAEYLQGLVMTGGSSNSMATSYTMTNLVSTTLGQLMGQMVNYGTNVSLM